MTLIRCIYSQEPGFPPRDQHPGAERYQVGDYIVDAVGGAPTIDEVLAVLNPPAPKPTVVTMRQARLALLQAGLLPAVEAAITQAGEAARIDWEYATTLDRNWPLVQGLVAVLELDDATLDALFAQAAAL